MSYPNQGILMIVFDVDRITDPRGLVNEPPISVNPSIQLHLSRKSEAVDAAVTAFIGAHETRTVEVGERVQTDINRLYEIWLRETNE